MKAALALLLLVASCSDGGAPESTPARDLSARAPSTASPIELPRLGPTSRPLGAPPASASPAEREGAIARLLAGEGEAAALPLADTDPDEPFDPRLRGALRSRAKVTIEVEASGMTPEGSKRADDAVQGRRMKIASCYVGGLTSNPNLLGKVSLRATLTAAGRPGKVELDRSDLPDAEVVRCIFAEVGRASFPAPEAPSATLTVQVMLAPGE